MSFYGINRYVCEVLTEMRKLLVTLDSLTIERHKIMQASLIEEAQTLVNRMESGLADWNDLQRIREELSKLKKELETLEKEKKALKKDNSAAKKS